MVLLRFLAFPAAGAATPAPEAAPPRRTAPEPGRDPLREARAAPLRTPAPPALSLPTTVPVQGVSDAQPPSTPISRKPTASAPPWDPTPSAPAPLAAEPPAPAFAEPTVSDQTLGNRWYALVKPLCDAGQLAALARELALQAGLSAIDETATPPRWHLTVERESLRTAVLRDKLAAVLAGALGRPVELVVEAGTPEDSPARRDAAARLRRQADAEATIQHDPVVRELLAQFKTARIVPGSIKPVAN
jgi:DNA polymerase-3 subunit gamma/tau